ncbi:DUF3027 domain-containing protein [Arthrobacter sp. D3-16]
MNREADQQDLESLDPESTYLEPPGLESPVIQPVDRVPWAAKPAKRRAGVPVWRTGKPDAFLAAAVDTARTAIEGITAASDIGEHLAAKTEGDRLVTHLFECRLPGYAGWQWFAVLTRNSRSKVVTVNELGLLPSEESILAPEWVPWAERVRPEDEQEQEQESGRGEDRAHEPEAATPDAGAQQADVRASHPDVSETDAAEPATTQPGTTQPVDGEAGALVAADLDDQAQVDQAQDDQAQVDEADVPEQPTGHASLAD